MTIEALAVAAGLHSHSVERIERGEQNITWESLASIATALDAEVLDVVRRASAYRGPH